MNLDTLSELKQKMGLSAVGKPALIGLAAVLVVAAVVIAGRLVGAAATPDYQIERSGSTAAVSAAASATASTGQPSSTAQGSLYVHVTGAVNKPGLCELAPGARLDDAIQAAGGFAPDAVTESVNLARTLNDGEQISVARQGDDQAPAPSGSPVEGAGEKTAASAPVQANLVNINTAPATELTTLPGIGEATAVKIVSERQANGPFASIDELTRVSGIGEKKLEGLRDLVCI